MWLFLRQEMKFAPVRGKMYPFCVSWGGVIECFSCNTSRRFKHLYYKSSEGVKR